MRNYFSQLKKNNHSTSFVSKQKRYGFNGDWRTYKCAHQIKSQILNSESTNFFHEIFFLIFFSNSSTSFVSQRKRYGFNGDCWDQHRRTFVRWWRLGSSKGNLLKGIDNCLSAARFVYNMWWACYYTAGWNVWGEWFLAVNNHNLKNWVPYILTHNLWLIFMGMKKKNFFWKKKLKWPTQKKMSFSTSAKFLWIGPWVSRIDWCEGHQCDSTYMAVGLSDVSSKKG